ncbi:MAG: hypothetical protein ACOH2V_13295 [Candidatus Saccharimonadaceae bacterium]
MEQKLSLEQLFQSLEHTEQMPPLKDLVRNLARKDPPFFKITVEGKVIYILGALHGIPVQTALPPQAFNKLHEIVVTSHETEKTILLLEHSATNEINLSVGNRESAKIGMTKSWVMPQHHQHYLTENNKKEFMRINSHNIFIDMEHVSDLPVRTLIELDPWLSAPILQIHVGVLMKKKFGGFEHDLETSEFWKPHWKAIHFLEDHQTVLDLAKEKAQDIYKDNLEWINGCLGLSVIESTYDTNPHIKKDFIVDHLQQINHYLWSHINDTDRYELSIARNHSWVIKTQDKLRRDDNIFLLVMGTAHLSGQENFLFLLLNSFRKEGSFGYGHEVVVERFSNEEGWVKFII